MKRFHLFRFALATMLAAMHFMATAAETGGGDALQRKLDALAQRARPGTLGVAVLDLQSGATCASTPIAPIR